MRMKKLGDYIAITKGKKHQISEEPSNKSIRFIQIDDLRNNNNIKLTDDSKGVSVVPDDLIIAWDGANAGTIGYGKEGFIGSTLARLRKKDKLSFDTIFLAKFLQSKFSYLRKTATGATIPHINRKALDSLILPNVEYNDQLRIANILSRAEALIVQRKESIQLLDELLKSTFLEMFLSKEIRNKWRYSKVKELVEKNKSAIKAGPFGSSLKKEFYVPSGYKIYGQEQVIKDDLNYGDYYINDELYKKLENCKIKAGDLLVSLVGTYGKISIVPDKFEPGIINPRLMKISFDKNLINPIYFKHLFTSEYLTRQLSKLSRGGTMNILNVGIVKEIEIPVPDINLQTQFAQIVEQVENIKIKYQESLQEMENLYASLSQKAFKGELDLTRKEV